jgi:chromosome segregation protein
LPKLPELELQRDQHEKGTQFSAGNLRAKYEESRKKEIESRAYVEKARDDLQDLEKRRDYLAARHAALGQILENPDGAGNLIKAKLRGIESLLADQVKVQPGYEKAVAAALGSLANAVSATSWAAAIAAISHLRENDLGRAELVVSGLAPQETQRIGLRGKTVAVSCGGTARA